jgi:hypothetical protein
MDASRQDFDEPSIPFQLSRGAGGVETKLSSRPSVPRAIVLGLQKMIPPDCFYGQRLRSQHWQRFFGFGRRKFPIEVREIFFGQFDVD